MTPSPVVALFLLLLILVDESVVHGAVMTSLTKNQLQSLRNEHSTRGTVVYGICIKSFELCRGFGSFLSEVDERFGPSSGVKVVEIDAAMHSGFVKELHVDVFPALIITRSGVESRYAGIRERGRLDLMLQYIESILLDTLPELRTAEDYERFNRNEENDFLRLVGYFPDEAASEYKTFLEITQHAEVKQLFAAARIAVPGILKLSDGTDAPVGTVSIRGAHLPGPSHLVYGRATSAGDLERFLRENAAAPMEEFQESTFRRLFFCNKTIAMMWHDETLESAESLLRLWNNLAKEFSSRYLFVVVKFQDFTSKNGPSTDFGVSANSLPGFLMMSSNPQEGAHYNNFPQEKEFTQQSLRTWLQDASETIHAPAMQKSQPVPEDPYDSEDGFMLAVGSTLNELVFSARSNLTLLMMYPEEACRRCKKIKEDIKLIRDRIPIVDRFKMQFVKFDPIRNDFDQSMYGSLSFIFPQFWIRTGAQLIHIDPRYSEGSYFEEIFKQYIKLDPPPRQTGHFKPSHRHSHPLADHHHHLSDDDCLHNAEGGWIEDRIRHVKQEIRTLYRFLHGRSEPEGFFTSIDGALN